MRLLYLYPEEWTGRRAREVHTLSTCIALAQYGVEVTLLTAGGRRELLSHVRDMTGATEMPGLHLATLSRTLGPIRSAAIFSFYFRIWLWWQEKFDWAYVIHLKAAAMLSRARLPYAYEAHEIFAETPQKNETRQTQLHQLEKKLLEGAALRIATSASLAAALRRRYGGLSDNFVIAPNAGLSPLDRGISAANGPFVYAGSIADWKGLDLVIQASRDAQVPLKIIGGTAEEWQQLGQNLDTRGIIWQSRVPLSELPEALGGARAGLIPTQPETPSGRYSCPMKLFDYARCGLSVISTALPSLQSLEVGPWCLQVSSPTREAWAETMRNFHYSATQVEMARNWAAAHTWAKRAEFLVRAFARCGVRGSF